MTIPIVNHMNNLSHNNHSTNDILLSDDMNIYHTDIRMILSELKFLTDYIRKQDYDDDLAQDWKFSAMVVDRLCLVVFTMMTTIFSYATLFSAPNILKFQ